MAKVVFVFFDPYTDSARLQSTEKLSGSGEAALFEWRKSGTSICADWTMFDEVEMIVSIKTSEYNIMFFNAIGIFFSCETDVAESIG